MEGNGRGRKINDGVRKGMPLRRLAAVIDFSRFGREGVDSCRRETHRRSQCRLRIADREFTQKLKLKF